MKDPTSNRGSNGHDIITAIAETQLTDTACKRIKELLPQGTTLADASTWPDKAGRQIPDMDPCHYINFPKDANTYDQQRDCKLATASSRRLPGMSRSQVTRCTA